MVCTVNAGMEGLDLMDRVIDPVLNYLDQFDRPNGLLIHLSRGPIKRMGSNLKLGSQDGLHMGL